MPHAGSSPTLVFLHHLGGSAQTWKPVEDRLAADFPCVRLDLPGFGDAAGEKGRSVAGMADWVQAHVADRVQGDWVLVGHSMSAKIALLIARRVADGMDARSGATPAGARLAAATLAGLVLAAGSPPAPEPMEEDKREEMLGWFQGGSRQSRDEADGFVKANLSGPLDDPTHDAAIRDVLRTSQHAWRSWLREGSLEDLREAIGTLRLPALVLAGADDEALGADIQRDHTMPHLPAGRLEVVENAAHLLPMEQPDRVAGLIAGFARELHLPIDHMTRRTIALLRARGASDAGYTPKVLDAAGFAVLRRLVGRLLPMPQGIDIDLAAKLDAKLQEAVGDGWRFASLPEDSQAYRQGLAALEAVARRDHGAGFAELPDAAVDTLVEALSGGRIEAGPGFMAGTALRDWCEDLQGDCCQIFITHPAVQSRTGILAAATGDDTGLRGFAHTCPDDHEPWETSVRKERA